MLITVILPHFGHINITSVRVSNESSKLLSELIHDTGRFFSINIIPSETSVLLYEFIASKSVFQFVVCQLNDDVLLSFLSPYHASYYERIGIQTDNIYGKYMEKHNLISSDWLRDWLTVYQRSGRKGGYIVMFEGKVGTYGKLKL